MSTQFTVSSDRVRIAFDVTGAGPVVLLLHGGGQDRRVWHAGGYVSRLAETFTVVTIDIRGNGESDRPETPSAYSPERIGQDFLVVADAINAPRFAMWGFSYGANVGRYLASHSEQADRVVAMVYIGIPFGPALDDALTTYVQRMPDRPAFATALLAYPPVEPYQMRCPTLWIVGSRNEGAMASVANYRDRLPGTNVTLAVIDGLTHTQEFDQIDRVFARAFEFTTARCAADSA